MTSLVQRRMATERGRNAGIAYLVIGAAWLIFGAIGWAVASGVATYWWNLGLAIAWLASGSFELWRYRRRMAALVEEMS